MSMSTPAPAPTSSRIPAASIRMLTRYERRMRLLYCIFFFYMLVNGSSISLLSGAMHALTWLWTHRDNVFWSNIGLGVLGIAVCVLGVWVARRWRLAISQTDLWLLGVQTLLVAGTIVIILAVVDHFFGPYPGTTYWRWFLWTWQIPAGFFIGQGLNWSIVDRQIAGVQAVDPRSTQEHHFSAGTEQVVNPSIDPTFQDSHHQQ